MACTVWSPAAVQLMAAGTVALALALTLVGRPAYPATIDAGAGAVPAETVWPGPEWAPALPREVGMDPALLARAHDYALTGGGAGMIIRHGRLVLAWGDPKARYDLKSTTKSIGMTAVGLALMDGKLSLDDLATDRHPCFGIPPAANSQTGWLQRTTLRQLATQTAGFAKPGGYEPLLFEPGSHWHYSDGGPNWLAECVALVYRRDLSDLMFERVFEPIGIQHDDLVWRDNDYRPHDIDGIPRREFGSGISANADAMARIGLLYIRGGQWNGRRIVPDGWPELVGRPDPSVIGLPEWDPETYGNASDHYGMLWWNNADGILDGVPRDAYWSWGLYDSLIVVIPSLDIVASRAGDSWSRPRDGWSGDYDVLGAFIQPICAAVGDAGPLSTVAPSPVIEAIDWAPQVTIRRAAPGSDNWPLTWADDGRLYTAYGDGWGFDPRAPRKLSLGLASIEGGPDNFTGRNLASPTGERTGDGATGEKASGMLMVGARLYMWLRNAGNSRLGWSDDRGRTWRSASWRFEESFGCPTFANYGRDYAGARDEYLYVFSPDSDSAYEAADSIVLARVRRDRATEREAYEFFAGLTGDAVPRWSSEIAVRVAVLRSQGRCYRLGVTYDPGLGRYLCCQPLPTADGGAPEGLAIYDAAEPWGPWTGAFLAWKWDVEPGESASLPTKWMSNDGKVVHLVFSGQDSFSVRRAVIRLRGDAAKPN